MPLSPHQVAGWLISGEDFLAQGNFVQALNAFEQALALAQQSRNPQAEAIALQRLGLTHLEQGQLSLSIASVQQAIDIALEQHNLNTLYECHCQLAQTYKSMGDIDLALQHLETADRLSNSFTLPGPHTPSMADAKTSTATPSDLAGQHTDGLMALSPAIAEQAQIGIAIVQASKTDQEQSLPWGTGLNSVHRPKDSDIQRTDPDTRDRWIQLGTRAIAAPQGILRDDEGAVEAITDLTVTQTTLQELASRDSLTQVYNRRHFIQLANREMARASRCNRPATLLLIDIDHFQAVNDTYGHLVGDAVLCAIAHRLQANLRQSDILARYGGEAFLVLMPATNQAQAWVGAERLRQIIATTPVDSGSSVISMTASIGLSCWPAHAATPPSPSLPQINDLIGSADQALYRAKRSGRNQTQAEAWRCQGNSSSEKHSA
jgi:diguanylate cyclase (GGDEF)-like protein